MGVERGRLAFLGEKAINIPWVSNARERHTAYQRKKERECLKSGDSAVDEGSWDENDGVFELKSSSLIYLAGGLP